MPPIRHSRLGSRCGNGQPGALAAAATGQPRALAAAATESQLTGTEPPAAAESRVAGTEPAADAAAAPTSDAAALAAAALAQPAADAAPAPTADATTALVTTLTIAAAAVATAAVAAGPNNLLGDHLLWWRLSRRRWLEPRLLRWHHARRRCAIHLSDSLAVGSSAWRNMHPGHD